MLALANDDGEFRVEPDASGTGIGGILSQKQNDVWQPVAFYSRTCTEAERNYEIYDLELLAIIECLREWRHYLMDARKEFSIESDHKNLMYFRKPQDLNRRQARWMNELANYHFVLSHKPGKQNRADRLSRRPDHAKGVDDNKSAVLLKDHLFRMIGLPESYFNRRTTIIPDIVEVPSDFQDPNFGSRYEDSIETIIRQSQKYREKFAIQGLQKGIKEWVEDEGVLRWNGRLYVPKIDSLRERIIRKNHDSILAGHPGANRTRELIYQRYWWPRITHDTKRYVSGCETCQRTKARNQKKAAPLNPNQIPEAPWKVISVDLIGPLPEAQGFDAILVIVDRFSKMIKVIPTHTTVTSEGVARIFRDHVFKLHGTPQKVISDRGSTFVSHFMRDLYKLLSIEANPSTAYHPQTDGQTERINREIEQYLRIYSNHRQDNWPEWLSLAEFSYNNKVNKSTGFSPFMIVFGQDPEIGTNSRRTVRNESAKEFVEFITKVREETKAALTKASEDMKRYYDKNVQAAREYKKGDNVWLEATHIHTDRPAKKLDDKRYGPFVIQEKIGAGAYKLQLPFKWKKIHPVVNECLLSPFTPPSFSSQQPPPQPPTVLVDDIPEHEIEKIIDSREVKGKIEYLIHWKGFPREEREWLPVKELKNAQKLVREFHSLHPDAKRGPHIKLSLRSQQTDSPCSCPICRHEPLPSSSSMFSSPAFLQFRNDYISPLGPADIPL